MTPIQEKEIRDRIAKEIDFLSDHWTMDDKKPFSFGGWREEVLDSILKIIQQIEEEAKKEQLNKIKKFVAKNYSINPQPLYAHVDLQEIAKFLNKLSHPSLQGEGGGK